MKYWQLVLISIITCIYGIYIADSYILTLANLLLFSGIISLKNQGEKTE